MPVFPESLLLRAHLTDDGGPEPFFVQRGSRLTPHAPWDSDPRAPAGRITLLVIVACLYFGTSLSSACIPWVREPFVTPRSDWEGPQSIQAKLGKSQIIHRSNLTWSRPLPAVAPSPFRSSSLGWCYLSLRFCPQGFLT